MYAKRRNDFLGADPRRPRPDSRKDRRDWRNQLPDVQLEAEEEVRFFRTDSEYTQYRA